MTIPADNDLRVPERPTTLNLNYLKILMAGGYTLLCLVLLKKVLSCKGLPWENMNINHAR
jgi:hypothetical protein